jgi:hypothetical protein
MRRVKEDVVTFEVSRKPLDKEKTCATLPRFGGCISLYFVPRLTEESKRQRERKKERQEEDWYEG